MSVSRVGGASATATSLTMPTTQAGDMMFMLAFVTGSGNSPTVPGGWNLLASANRSAGSSGTRWFVGLYYQVAAGGDGSGTWTGASGLVALVYRGADTPTSADCSVQGANGSTSIDYPAFTLSTLANSWFACLVGTASTGADTAPGGLSSVTTTGTREGGYDSNGIQSSNWTDQTVTVASENWGTAVLEIRAAPFLISLTDTGVSIGDSTLLLVAPAVPADTGVSIGDSISASKSGGGTVFPVNASDTGVSVTESLAAATVRLVADTVLAIADSTAPRTLRPLADVGATVTDGGMAARIVRVATDTGATITDSIFASKSGGGTTFNRAVADFGLGPPPIVFGPLG